ncbi:MAG TPA: MATE family efflux transporter [Spirochaetales bacterium]|jgi:putative MATE family efflux protein|nr:MATE family efflux transporter [Spirochaetales bacterium]
MLIVPLIAEQFLAITIGMVDTMMVASVGEAAVGAVSIVDSISHLMVQLFASFATGGAVVASQYLGRKDQVSANESAKQLFILSLSVATLLLILCMPIRKNIISFIFGSIEADVLQNSTVYFSYILLSLPFLASYNACAALFRSMGNSKVSLIVSTLMNITNIVGNAYFIFTLKMGVAGAGLATLLSRMLAATIMIILISNKNNIIFIHKIWKFEWHWHKVKKILQIGIPTGIEGSIFHIGRLMVQSFIASFGTVALAANAISNSVASLANIPGRGINMASITIIGQSLGAKRPEMATFYGKRLLFMAYVSIALITIPLFILAPSVVQIFNLSAEATILASNIIRTAMVASTLIWPFSFTIPNFLRAAGDVKYTMVVSMFSMWVFRVGSSYVLSFYLGFGVYGVWFGMYIDWLCRGIFYIIRFSRGKWKTKKVI